jgi:hypothetical protein
MAEVCIMKATIDAGKCLAIVQAGKLSLQRDSQSVQASNTKCSRTLYVAARNIVHPQHSVRRHAHCSPGLFVCLFVSLFLRAAVIYLVRAAHAAGVGNQIFLLPCRA